MDEYIKRESAIAIIEEKQRALCPKGRCSRHYVYGSDRDAYDNWQEIADAIEAISAADVRPVTHGKWEDEGTIENYPKPGFNNYHLLVCSNCGCMHRTRLQDNVGFPINGNFCPNCGADMREAVT